MKRVPVLVQSICILCMKAVPGKPASTGRQKSKVSIEGSGTAALRRLFYENQQGEENFIVKN